MIQTLRRLTYLGTTYDLRVQDGEQYFIVGGKSGIAVRIPLGLGRQLDSSDVSAEALHKAWSCAVQYQPSQECRDTHPGLAI